MTATVVPSPPIVFREYDSNNNPLVGGKLFTYAAGTTTKQNTYTDSTGATPQTNPIVLNSRGEAVFWPDATLAYKYVLAPANDTDPPSAPIWTVDNLPVPASLAVLVGYSSASQGAGLVGFNSALSYAANTVGAWLVNLATSVGSTLIGYLAAGSGAVSRLLSTKLQETVSILDYGGIIYPTVGTIASSTVYNNNTTALANAYAASGNGRVFIPPGVLTLAANTVFPPNLQLIGAGAGVSIVQASGNMFTLPSLSSANNNCPSVQDITLQNVAGSPGALITYAVGTAIPRIKYTRVEFDYANYHIYTTTDLVVAHYFNGCRFNGAIVASRYYGAGCWALEEYACYVWFNLVGLQIVGSSSTNNIVGSVYEYNTGSGIILDANGGDILGFNIKAHFEGNGSATPYPADVQLKTSTANQLRSIVFDGCGWFVPNGSQTNRISLTTGGGGNAANITVRGGYVAGNTPLCPQNNAITIEPDVSFQTTSGGPISGTNRTPRIASPVSGANVGSNAVTATLTPPGGVQMIEWTVKGNYYNGVAGSHTGYAYGKYFGDTGQCITIAQVANGVGANQSFVVTFSAGVLTVTNAAAMTANQSGDVYAIYHG